MVDESRLRRALNELACSEPEPQGSPEQLVADLERHATRRRRAAVAASVAVAVAVVLLVRKSRREP